MYHYLNPNYTKSVDWRAAFKTIGKTSGSVLPLPLCKEYFVLQ